MLSPRRLRKTAILLLLAMMAMLPLQSLQAAMQALGHHAGDSHSPSEHLEHVMIDATGMHACQMHDHQQPQNSHDSQHCSSNGCDMCGSCSTTLPLPFAFTVNHDRFLPEPIEQQQSFSNEHAPLYRPPRA